MKKLKIYYDGTPDWEMEKKLKKFLKEFGWSWYGEGYNSNEDKRDIAFEKV